MYHNLPSNSYIQAPDVPWIHHKRWPSPITMAPCVDTFEAATLQGPERARKEQKVLRSVGKE